MPPSATELAREAQKRADDLRAEFDAFKENTEKLQLQELRDRLIVLEQKLILVEKELEAIRTLPVIKDRVDKLEKELETIRTIPALQERVAELVKQRDEGDKRRWQFVLFILGVLATTVIQLVISFLRK